MVAVSPSAVTAVVARVQPADGPAQALLRAEALTPATTARTGLLAWEMRLDVDCQTGEVRTGATTGYAARRSGDGVAVAPAQPDWRRPAPGTTLDAAWRSMCDARFQPPLTAPAPGETAENVTAAASPRPSPARAGAGRPGRGATQVVSSPVEADTKRSLESLRNRFGEQLAGLETRVEAAQVHGRTVYRGVVAGFAGHEDAAAFCRSLRSRGQDCLAR